MARLCFKEKIGLDHSQYEKSLKALNIFPAVSSSVGSPLSSPSESKQPCSTFSFDMHDPSTTIKMAQAVQAIIPRLHSLIFDAQALHLSKEQLDELFVEAWKYILSKEAANTESSSPSATTSPLLMPSTTSTTCTQPTKTVDLTTEVNCLGPLPKTRKVALPPVSSILPTEPQLSTHNSPPGSVPPLGIPFHTMPPPHTTNNL
ncbi:hypothetical protein Pelo_768 [Pelomyxa schiedti]|nr:hypothetical protein Pelo_768 [Pelomyxa schiedti]